MMLRCFSSLIADFHFATLRYLFFTIFAAFSLFFSLRQPLMLAMPYATVVTTSHAIAAISLYFIRHATFFFFYRYFRCFAALFATLSSSTPLPLIDCHYFLSMLIYLFMPRVMLRFADASLLMLPLSYDFRYAIDFLLFSLPLRHTSLRRCRFDMLLMRS